MNVDLHKPLLGDTVDDEINVDTTHLKRPNHHNGSDRKHLATDDDDDDAQSVWFLCSLKIMGSGDDDDDDDDDDDVNDLEKNRTLVDDGEEDATNKNSTESSTSSKWYWNCFISSILPLLLYFQFYITYHYNDSEVLESSSSMIMMTNDWSSIQWSIFLFVVTSVLYRQSMAYQHNDSSNRSGKESSISYFELILHLVPDIIIDVLLILILFHYYIAAVLVMQLSTIFLAVSAILNSCNCSIYIGTTSHDGN
jgi:hypothetical protein